MAWLSNDLMGMDQVKKIIKRQVTDIECQNDLSRLSGFYITEKLKNMTTPVSNLSQLEIPKIQTTFTLTLCWGLPSMVLEDHYKKVPFKVVIPLWGQTNQDHRACFAELYLLQRHMCQFYLPIIE